MHPVVVATQTVSASLTPWPWHLRQEVRTASEVHTVCGQAATARSSAEPGSPLEHAVELDSDEEGDAGEDRLIKAHGATY